MRPRKTPAIKSPQNILKVAFLLTFGKKYLQ